MLIPYHKCEFEPFEVTDTNGQTYIGVFSQYRVDPKTVPEGFNIYDLRHGDDDSIPCTVEKSVLVNHYGTFMTVKPLAVPMDISDWSYLGGSEEYITDVTDSE